MDAGPPEQLARSSLPAPPSSGGPDVRRPLPASGSSSFLSERSSSSKQPCLVDETMKAKLSGPRVCSWGLLTRLPAGAL